MAYVDDEGKPMDFPQTVALLLVKEHGRTPDEADALVKLYPNIIMQGIMANMNIYATAMALQVKDSGGEVER